MCFIVCLIILSFYYSHAMNNIDIYRDTDYNHGKGPFTSGSDIFKFGYHINDNLHFAVKPLNKPPNATATICITYQPVGSTFKSQITSDTVYDMISKFMHSYDQRMFVDIEMVTETGSCSIRVSEGRAVTSPPTWPADEGYEYTDTCFRHPGCGVQVDLRNGCKDIPTTTTRPFTKNETSNTFVSNVPTSPRDSVEITTDKMTANDSDIVTVTPTTTTRPLTKNNTNVPTSPRDNVEITTNKMTANDTESDSNATRYISDTWNTTDITGDHEIDSYATRNISDTSNTTNITGEHASTFQTNNPNEGGSTVSTYTTTTKGSSTNNDVTNTILKLIAERMQNNNNASANSTFEDGDRYFLLSLLNDFKKIPENRKMDVKYDVIGIIRKYAGSSCTGCCNQNSQFDEQRGF